MLRADEVIECFGGASSSRFSAAWRVPGARRDEHSLRRR
jgi:hypothetical protein